MTENTIRELFEAHGNFRKLNTKGKDKDKDTNDSEEGKGAGIRKIRMGTFEDSGKCKGSVLLTAKIILSLTITSRFAFVDFTSVEHATNALINPRNHRLNGRDLVVEYASADAVRRGGGNGGPKNAKQERQGKGERVERKTSSSSKHDKPRSKPDQGDVPEEISMEPTVTRPLERQKRTDHSHKKRARPGAALAQAPRQSAAILPSEGQKIVF